MCRFLEEDRKEMAEIESVADIEEAVAGIQKAVGDVQVPGGR